MLQGSPLTAHKLLPTVVLVAGLAISAFAGWVVHTDIQGDTTQRFTSEADRATALIEDRLQSLGLVLRGGAGAFADPANPLPAEWKVFTQQLQPQLTLPGIQGIGFAQAVPADSLEAHLANVRSWGFADYTITPADPREFYTSVVFLEPFEGRNLRAFGYDMYSEPVRRAAMEQARDSGQPSLSGKVLLVQEDESDQQAGALLYFPLFLQGPGLTDTAGRRRALLGWTYIPLRMQDFIGGALQQLNQQWSAQAHLYIYDSNTTDAASVLYGNPQEHALLEQQDQSHLHRSISFNGHDWTLVFDYSAAAANADLTQAWMSFGVGAALSLLVSLLLRSQLTLRERSDARARDLTTELREQQQQLAASEYRWKFALEGAGDGLWDWNIPAETVYFAPTWKRMLGYADDEIGNSLGEWSNRVHPNDLQLVMKTVQDYLEGRTQQYSCEHRVLCKDGSYKWILDRGMVVTRDADGRPLRMLGTHKDISDRKQAEDALQRSRQELLQAQRIAKVGSWSVDVKTNQAEWSSELLRMHGIDPAHEPPTLPELPALFTRESWDRMSTALERCHFEGTPYELELEFIRPDGSTGFMLARGEAERDAEGRIAHIRGIAADITERVLAKRRIETLNRLYAALSACNDAIVHCNTAEALFQRVCEIIVLHGGMNMAWVGLIDPTSGKIVPRHSAGEGTEYLSGISITMNKDDPHGRGPTGIAAREGHSVWIDDFRTNPITAAWRQRGANYGWLSSAALPLCREGKPVGALTLYSTQPNWFTEDNRALIEEMSRNIGYALDKLQAEKEAAQTHRTLVEAEQRFRSLVEQSLIGAFIIQDKQFVYVNPQLETILGYPHDGSLLRMTPASVVAESDRGAMQVLVDRLRNGSLGNIEHVCSAVRRDGSLIDVGITLSNASYDQRPATIGMLQDMSNRKVAEEQIKRYAHTIEKVFLQTVSMTTNIVEQRDPYTAGHEKHVAEIAVRIGRELQLEPERLQGLQIGGYLHDVGKIAAPSEILTKPGRLSPVEFNLIKQHAEAGYQILKEVDFPWPVAQIARQHHERMDGSGYPQGLKGDEILLEARIVAVADVLESMISHRPYRPALGTQKAFAELEEGRGTKYDAAVVDACLRIYRDQGNSLPSHG